MRAQGLLNGVKEVIQDKRGEVKSKEEKGRRGGRGGRLVLGGHDGQERAEERTMKGAWEL